MKFIANDIWYEWEINKYMYKPFIVSGYEGKYNKIVTRDEILLWNQPKICSTCFWDWRQEKDQSVSECLKNGHIMCKRCKVVCKVLPSDDL